MILIGIYTLKALIIMKNPFLALFLLMQLVALSAFAGTTIRISTNDIDLILQTSPANRLYQVYFGEKLASTADFSKFDWKVYPGSDGSYCARGHEFMPVPARKIILSPHLPSPMLTVISPPIYIIKARSRKLSMEERRPSFILPMTSMPTR